MFVCFKHTVQFGIYVSNAIVYIYMIVCFKRAVQFGTYVSNRIVLPSEGPFENPNWSQNRSPDGSGTVPGAPRRGP